MKIIELNAYYKYGSTGDIVHTLYNAGKQQGYEMFVIYWLGDIVEEDNESVFYCGEKNPPRIQKMAQYLFNGGKLNYNSNRTKQIIERIAKISPDIIHIHNLHGDFEYGSIDITMLFDFLSKRKIKCIWTLHDCWSFTGRCYHFQYKKCEKWKSGCGKCPQRIYDRHGVLFDYSDQNLAIKNKLYHSLHDLTIVTVSHWLEKMVNESILSDFKVKTIYNGVDCSVFNYVRSTDKHGILCVGWDRKKGYKDYYKIAKLLPHEEIYVLGNRPFFRRIRKLPHNIHVIPYITSKNEMANQYRKSSLYFNASIAETFGLTTVEALACGIPVVGYNTTATPEIIDRELGRTIEKNDTNTLLKTINELIYNDNEQFRIKRATYVKNYFSKEMMIESYMKLFGEI